MTRSMQWRVDIELETNAESNMNELHIYLYEARFMNEISVRMYMGL